MSPKQIPENALQKSAGLAHSVYASGDLLGETRECRIMHAGSEYRLRQTKAGKLILTK